MKWILNATLALTVVLSAPLHLSAQRRADVELSLFGGTSFFSKQDFEIGPPQAPTPVPMEFELDRGFRGGLRVNMITSNRWGIEVFAALQKSDATFRRSDDSSLDLTFPTQVYHIGVNLHYYPLTSRPGGRIVPFVTGGIGGAIYRPTAEGKRVASDPLQGGLPDLIESGRLAYNYGAGVKYRLTTNFGVRADARGYFSKSPTYGLDTASDVATTPVLPLNSYTHNTELSVGITFRLWGGQ